jgi:hypothetical protein
MKNYTPKRHSYLANSPINSRVDLAIYRTYKYILKHQWPMDISTIRGETALITFAVLRDRGVIFL